MKLVIVGRDGVLCLEREGGLASPDDWEALPGNGGIGVFQNQDPR